MNPLNRNPEWRMPLVVYIICTLIIACGVSLQFYKPVAHRSLFTISNLVGPTAKSLLQTHDLTVVTEEMGTPGNPIAFHSARMPVASIVVSASAKLFGANNQIALGLLKAFLLLIPLWMAAGFAMRATARPWWTFALLLVPFFSLGFLADVVNTQVEEAYAYSFLALCFAIALFGDRPLRHLSTLLLAAFALGFLFLTKSSTLPMVIVIAAGLLLTKAPLFNRAVFAALVCAFPLCWGLYQHHASGHFTLGTSVDGINLHKGNHPGFLSRYPPSPGTSLDNFDWELNRGKVFADEWSYDSFHKQAAISFILQHPGLTARADVTKARVFLFSLTKYGSSKTSGMHGILESAGILLFRIALWTAMLAGALTFSSRFKEKRFAGALFLAVVAACAAPFIAGFAYTRHAFVLFYPSTLWLSDLASSRMACSREDVTTHAK